MPFLLVLSSLVYALNLLNLRLNLFLRSISKPLGVEPCLLQLAMGHVEFFLLRVDSAYFEED